MREYIEKMLCPESIVVIGASGEEGSVGNDIAKNIVEGSYQGKVFLVNPKIKTLFGKTVYADIDDVPETADLALIIVPAKIVPDVLVQCGEKGIRSVIVISAGFREAGNVAREEDVVEIAHKYGMALLGPNCLGILNPHIQLNASFAPLTPKGGNIAFLSQSGALCASVLDWAKEHGVGFSKFISTGNKAVLDERVLLEYLIEDEKTDVIALYIEDLRQTDRLIDLLQTSGRKKPVIVLKSGKTKEGSRASASHTGALAGSDEAYDALFRQSGIIRVSGTQELFWAMEAFSLYGENYAENGAVVITNAGGPGVLATDALSECGVVMRDLSLELKNEMRSFFPPAASVNNPIDVLGDAHADRYEKALDCALRDDSVQAVCIILTPQTMTEVTKTAQIIAEKSQTTRKIILPVFMGDELVHEGVSLLKEVGLYVAGHPNEAGFVLGLFEKRRKFLQKSFFQEKTKEAYFSSETVEDFRLSLNGFGERGITEIPEAYASPFLEKLGFQTLRSKTVTTSQDALLFAQEIGEKIVLKIVSPDILHKSDVGGVRVGVSLENVVKEFESMGETVRFRAPHAKIEGIMVMEMAPERGLHMVVGAKRDDALGPILMVGLGGVYVEVFRDVSFGVLPLYRHDAQEMISNLRSFPILNGARGGDVLDTNALIDVLLSVASMMELFPEIRELDINPLLVREKGKGCILLDSRLVLFK